MSITELLPIVTGGLVVLLLLLLVAVIRKLSNLGEQVADAGDPAALIRLDTRLTDMGAQADRREAAIRDEFRANRDEISKAVANLAEQIRRMGAEANQAQTDFRDKLDQKMAELRTENSAKLEEMRKTVDEKLQTTLERRLSESFKTVSERLEAVHAGLGEMQKLATGVGDLKRVLTNVKSRGTFGEVQLELLIHDFLTPDQFLANFDCGKRSGGERVEFGIKVPGTAQDVFLPVDAKFPTEDYERLLAAVEVGDKDAIDAAGTAIERAIRRFAKDIADKYINPPYTTDWAILFVPTEGLYAEVLRRPGLFEALQRDLKVTVAGPTNFQVLLSTFRMQFKQVALAERASEVWQVLGAVKGEFERYGEQVGALTKSLSAAQNHVEKLDVRRRQMLRALKGVETLEEGQAAALLGSHDENE
ncbi:DNA recombination protein RmuC [Gimibacter soli]|uniref:DNA recombination protein RmuC homolog n=1 Tax=Gimibacter soli TaxID=3024400 RepID=A0AAE9XW87_9PROT|nr:DNA recombination protein RmuC [Gimibacter soli]WCL55503.1 DNA recombination protein RmuC [Gimibacter soli]